MKALIRFSHDGKIYEKGDAVSLDDEEMMKKLKARKLIGTEEKKTTEKKENPTGKK